MITFIPHPIVVHFPIALLTLYALFELIRFRKVLEKPYWFYVKAFLVSIGAASALLAVLTGPQGGEGRIYFMHQRFAIATVIIFGIIALLYSKRKVNPRVVVPLAILGLISIAITGGLGGAMVYGTSFDPYMAPVFKLLGVY